MRKLFFVIALAFVLLAASIGCAFAEEFKNQALVDEAELLAPDQAAAITEKLDAVRNKFGVDVAIYTEDEMTGYDAMSTADDIYDYLGYGAGDDDDGILLYVSLNPRSYYFTTHGYGMEVFTDNGLIYLEKKSTAAFGRGGLLRGAV